ncbi:MAG: PDZ domain-containing protein [Candidatus Sericytochromatia bacterium]|nr:PDZ domain-containing protein [Candidatus Sericytochromatia bacterium]
MRSPGSEASVGLLLVLGTCWGWGVAGPAWPAVVRPAPSLGPALGPFVPYSGLLGLSGLRVQATPTMWLVTGVVPGGAADLAGVPDPRVARLRLVAIGGREVEGFSRAELLSAFAEVRGRVALTLARRRPGEAGEVWLGPFELPLGPGELASIRRKVAAARARLLPGPRGKSPDRLWLEAHQARADRDASRLRAAIGALGGADAGGKAAAWWAELHEHQMGEVLRAAEAAAADGRYEQARQLLRGLQPSGTWGSVRRARDAEYGAALAARKARQAERQREEALRKAADAARGPGASPPPRRIKL